MKDIPLLSNMTLLVRWKWRQEVPRAHPEKEGMVRRGVGKDCDE